MKTVVSSISYDSLWGHDGTWANYHSTTEVPDFSDLAKKADLSFVNQKIGSIKNDINNKITTLEEQTQTSIQSINDFVQNSLSSKERIECEKNELSQFFDILTSKIKTECQTIEKQLSKEIKAYQDIDKALDEKLSILINQKKELLDSKNYSSTIIGKITKQTSLAENVLMSLKENPNMISNKFKNDVKTLKYINYFFIGNVVLLDLFFIFKFLFS